MDYYSWKTIASARACRAVRAGAETWALPNGGFFSGGRTYTHGLRTKLGTDYVVCREVMRDVEFTKFEMLREANAAKLIGARLRESRAAKGWPLVEASKQLRRDTGELVGHRSWAKWEQGERMPTPEQAEALVQLFGAEPGYFSPPDDIQVPKGRQQK